MQFHRIRLAAFLVPALMAAALFASCGGDGDGNSGGGTGSDEKFVADICKAGAKFQADMEKAFPQMVNAKSEEEAIKIIIEPFETMAKSFKAAKPPADLKEWHAEASKAFDDAVKALKSGNTDSALFESDSPFPDPPAAAQERLQKIAEKNDDCQKAGTFLGE